MAKKINRNEKKDSGTVIMKLEDFKGAFFVLGTAMVGAFLVITGELITKIAITKMTPK